MFVKRFRRQLECSIYGYIHAIVSYHAGTKTFDFFKSEHFQCYRRRLWYFSVHSDKGMSDTVSDKAFVNFYLQDDGLAKAE